MPDTTPQQPHIIDERQHNTDLQIQELQTNVASLATTSEAMLQSVSELKTAVASMLATTGKTDLKSIVMVAFAVVPMMLSVWAFGVKPIETHVSYLNKEANTLTERFDKHQALQTQEALKFHEWKGSLMAQISQEEKATDVLWQQIVLPGLKADGKMSEQISSLQLTSEQQWDIIIQALHDRNAKRPISSKPTE